jgi:signal transduction histidine kinase
MGLHIVREILREHGGDIRLDESSGGTRFAGEIPRVSEVLKI